MAALSASRRLARFVLGLRLDDVPAPVVARARLLALDTLGNCLAASGEDFARAVVETAERLGGPAESTVIGSGIKVAAANAVLANATLAHGLDFDDTREDAIVHTGCVAVTAALAVAEAANASGREALEAAISTPPPSRHRSRPPPPPRGSGGCPRTSSCTPSASAGARPPESSST